ncbi:type VI secretion system Vgr family protein [Pseudomonas sp. NPDC090202]|uniref:type VI secretion system Vgr family protein n=1 Tax=unclassified Pseudomonas TaxID=196821 RepID=UPI00382A1E92
MTMILETSDCPGDLQIISVSGHDSLNAPFRFEIDVVSRDPRFEQADMLQAGACLILAAAGQPEQRIHGQIFEWTQHYRGSGLSLYRLTLMPELQRLALRSCRRVLNGQSVPQIITGLLREHGVADDGFRFEHLLGVYPPRHHCVQFDESDLQLLQRLCAEEGIVFRFEHHHDRHVLVFSDDPAGFPECLQPAQVDDLAEHLSMRACHSSHWGASYVPQPVTRLSDWADNDTLPADINRATPADHRQQLRERQLQRLRCERRRVVGHSRLPWLVGGRVIRVEAHADLSLNDQWLLKEVHHVGKQWAAPDGCSPADQASLLQYLGGHEPPVSVSADTPGAYHNTFEVTPWEMPFRPTLPARRPQINARQPVTQTSEKPDRLGRISFRYDWQIAGSDCWATVVGSLPATGLGTRLQVAFFDGDPDQPLICGILDVGVEARTATTLVDLPCEQRSVRLQPGQHLILNSQDEWLLRSAAASIHVTADGIGFSPVTLAGPRAASTARQSPPEPPEGPQDLQLRHPELSGRVLPHCAWYIVRMAKLDLKRLPRLCADDILFEGETDADGWLGLGRDDLVRLLQLQREFPGQLCLAHPGHCRALLDCFWPVAPDSQQTLDSDAEIYP